MTLAEYVCDNGHIFCSALSRSPWWLHGHFKAFQGLPATVKVSWSSPVLKGVCIYCLWYRIKHPAYHF